MMLLLLPAERQLDVVVVGLNPGFKQLNEEEKAKVNRYIDTLLSKQAPLPLIEHRDREIVEQRTINGVSYQLEKVKCGKNCHGCPHGPYWYAYFRRGGKVVSRYIGKNLKTNSYVTERNNDNQPVT